MKRRWFAVVLSTLLAAGLLTGCGSNSLSASKDAAGAAAGEGAYYEETYETADASNSVSQSGSALNVRNGDAKLIYTGDMSLQTTDLAAATQSIEQLTAECGGYLERSERYTAEAYYTVRVPQNSFDAFMSAAGTQAGCRVIYQSTSTDDVSESYADLENRLETLNIKLERLQSLLTQAESMEDIITIENSISETESEIEQITGQKNHYDSLIGFSTVTVSVMEVSALSEGENASFGQRLSAGFLSGLSAFGEGCADALVWCVSHVLTIALFAAVVVAVLLLVRRKRKRRMEKHNPTDVQS